MNELSKVKRRILHLSQRTTDRGCTEAEALEAMAKIGELLEVYNLQLADCLLPFNDEKCIETKVHTRRLTTPRWHYIFPVIGRFTGTKVWSSKPYVKFFGFEPDVQMAVYMANLLLDTITTETKRFHKTDSYLRSAKRRFHTNSFVNGLVRRLAERLEPMAPKAFGNRLVVKKAAKIEEDFRRANPSLKLRQTTVRSVRVNLDAYNAGQSAGNNVNINRPVGHQSPSISGYLT